MMENGFKQKKDCRKKEEIDSLLYCTIYLYGCCIIACTVSIYINTRPPYSYKKK